MISKQDRDAIIEWVENDNRSNVSGRVLFLWSPFKTFLNSLVSEDESLVVKSKSQYRRLVLTGAINEAEITKRKIEEYARHIGDPARYNKVWLEEIINWLDSKEGEE